LKKKKKTIGKRKIKRKRKRGKKENFQKWSNPPFRIYMGRVVNRRLSKF
jgi:hypothetical protein